MRLIPTRLVLPTAFAASLLGASACQSATVRGTDGRSLTARTPIAMTLHRGASAPLEIGIDRERFNGPVVVSVFQLPGGVTADKSSIKSESTSATFILAASRNADLVKNQALGVTVADPEGRTATQFVDLTVTD